MKKRLILFLVILANISFAQNFDDDRVREHYYQFLLEKWQESANWQELEVVDTASMLHLILIDGIAKRSIKEYYKDCIDLKKLTYLFSIHGEQREYVLALTRELPNNEQMWFLISRANGNILSIYKNEQGPNLPMEDEYMRGEAYMSLIPILDIDTIIPCLSSWEPRWPNTLTNDNKEIDSITAIAIATEAAEECYCVKMTSFAGEGFTIFDINGNNWDVQDVVLFPRIEDDGERQQYCLSKLISAYRWWQETIWRPQNSITRYSCPTPLRVLILKKDGRVLEIKKL